MQYTTLAVALLAGAVSAQTTHRVDVGPNGQLVFSPDSIVAAVGDIVEYHFNPKNHSVVQGAFNTPCQTGSVTDGFFSGFMPTPSGENSQVFQITVKDTKPIWVYCSQTAPLAHCPRGMVSAINAPATGNTLAAYAAGAAKFNGTVTFPAQVQGGSIVANNSTSSSLPPSSSATAATTSAAGPSGTGSSSSGSGSGSGSSGSGTGSSNATVSSPAPPASSTPGAAANVESMGIKGLVAVALGVAALFV
ncbi:hypothetical protein B7463_g2051, partial [Scytalidium lignicola]